jgi:uncharacterized protein (DUF1501 family)
MHVNRREFLRKSICAALGGASVYSALGNLRLLSAAAAASSSPYVFSDYKALVCVYLYGGNDSVNTIVPYDAAHYPIYSASRQGLALAQAAISGNNLNPLAASGGLPGGLPSDGGSYGLHPSMTALRGLFNSGKAAVVANVGTLLRPTTRTDYDNGNSLPPQLFSHDDQTNFWQTSRPDDVNANGWGGRVADLLYSGNPNQQLSMSISLAGDNRFQRAAIVNQYAVDPGGLDTVSYLDNDAWGTNTAGITAYNSLIAPNTQINLLERAYAGSAKRAIDNYTIVNAALAASSPLTTVFPDTDLGNQLQMVAKLIKIRTALGMGRQVFFVATGNYDTHGTQLADQQDNLAELSDALAAFYNATVELTIANSVTAFTASDFGRSLSINADGTDHGWGGHHFVVGGGVRGQRFYGTMPNLVSSDSPINPDDTGGGQIIPSTSVDQYSATLASWFGVAASDVASIFPNLPSFSTNNLRFMG